MPLWASLATIDRQMFLKNYYLNSSAKTDIHLLTHELKRAVQESGTPDGLAVILVTGGTAGVALLEEGQEIHEAYRDLIEAQVPVGEGNRPTRRSGSGAMHAQLRAALVGAQVSVPVQGGRPMLGNWQEVVLFDFDDKIGRREISIQVISAGGQAK